MQELKIEQFIAQARELFGPSTRRIDPARSNLRPWIPMRFYTTPTAQRSDGKKKRR